MPVEWPFASLMVIVPVPPPTAVNVNAPLLDALALDESRVFDAVVDAATVTTAVFDDVAVKSPV